MKPTVLSTLLTSAAAFAPIKHIRTTSCLQLSSITDTPIETSAVTENRPVWDPFGLYPTDTEERSNKREQIENQIVATIEKHDFFPYSC